MHSETPIRRAGGWRAAWLGAVGFGAISLIAYATVAFAGRWLYRNLTEPGAYAFWAAVYLGGTPWLLARLLVTPAGRRRFVGLFVLGFLAYALGWVAAYFPLRDKLGEALASVVGPALLGTVLCAGYGRWRAWAPVAAVLIVGHAMGYFAGDAVNTWLRGPAGMVLWGVCHGLGYGAAIGWATWRVGQGWTGGGGSTREG